MQKRYFLFLIVAFSFILIEVSYAQNDSSYVRDESKESEVIKPQIKEKRQIGNKDKIFIGFYPGFSWSNYAFSYEISPLIGYEVFHRFSAGVGIVYKHSESKTGYYTATRIVPPHVANFVGGRVFAFYDVYKSFCAYIEYEGARINYKEVNADLVKLWQPAIKVGILYKSELGNRASANFLLLYNFLHDEDKTITPSPLDIRIGFSFYPFRSKSY